MTYDIVYSILVHESSYSLVELIKNIEMCNVNNNYLIILHLNVEMYNIIQNNISSYKNVIINNKYYNKKLFTMSLLRDCN